MKFTWHFFWRRRRITDGIYNKNQNGVLRGRGEQKHYLETQICINRSVRVHSMEKNRDENEENGVSRSCCVKSVCVGLGRLGGYASVDRSPPNYKAVRKQENNWENTIAYLRCEKIRRFHYIIKPSSWRQRLSKITGRLPASPPF